jgi:predicted secreted hydrolase
MKKLFKPYLILFVGVIIVAAILIMLDQAQHKPVASRLSAVATPVSSEGFSRASRPIQLTFPPDHGPHPDFQTEWWYYTGNLQTADGRHFGYQLTFFRRALLPPDQVTPRASTWGSPQVYMAHFALTDVQRKQFYSFERLERGATGLAGAQGDPFEVWLRDWRVEEIEPGVYHLSAAEEAIAIDLTLIDRKGPVLQGDQGYSQKGPEIGNASYYVSLTRLESQGTILIDDTDSTVEGLSWMDHEWSTSALAPDQVGWDWFSIQLNDDTEMMLFQIRDTDGRIDPFSGGTFIHSDGATEPFTKDEFTLEVLDTWTSPNSSATYPSRWRLTIPSRGLDLLIEPHQADQELNVSYSYWEGAVKIRGTLYNLPVTGNGYVELTGYAGSMGGDF